MSRENPNYRIGTDLLDDGRMRAQARGAKTNRRTYPDRTTHHDAAFALARAIDPRAGIVVQVSASADDTRRDFAVHYEVGESS
jgi:hypothetical protein